MDENVFNMIKSVLDEKLITIATMPWITLTLQSKNNPEAFRESVIALKDSFDCLERCWLESPFKEVSDYLTKKGVGSEDFYMAKAAIQELASRILPD